MNEQSLLPFSKTCQVSVADGSLVEVAKHYSINANTLHYPIRLTDSAARQYGSVVLTTEIEFYDSLTGQKQVIPVGVNMVPLMEQAKSQGK